MTEKPGFDYKFETLDVAVADGIAVVSLDNPPVNAFSRQMTIDIAMCCDTMSEDAAVRVIVLTGKGKHFCAGADLKNRAAVTAHPSGPRQLSRLNRECFHSIRECRKPVIAAINGAALGAGLAIVASCDILLASEKASVGLPEIDVGLMGGGRHSQRLFSHSRLRRMALTGYRAGGAELYRLGVVEACLPPDELLPAAMQMAADIAAKSPLAAQMFKTTLNAIEHMTIRDGYRYEQDQTIAIGKTEDSKEAQRAFLEKRKPVFTGR